MPTALLEPTTVPRSEWEGDIDDDDLARIEMQPEDDEEHPMGAVANWTSGSLHYQMFGHSKKNKLGWVLSSDTGFRCFPFSPRLTRKPDASFIKKGRLPEGKLPTGDIDIHPDIAVEVLSPNDVASYVFQKIDDYLRAGVSLVWLVDPPTRTAYVYRPDGTALRLTAEQELEGEGVFPGFRVKVGDLFPPESEDA